MPDVKEAERFLDWLFRGLIGTEHKGNPLRCLIWSAPSKRSSFYTDTTLAASKALELTDKRENVYFGLGLISNPPKRGRGKHGDIDAISCFWIDVDYVHEEAHKPKPRGKVLPPSEEAARQVLDEMPVKPSIITHSGHGLQGYWLFKEPIKFTNRESRNEVARFSELWNATVRAVAENHKWTIDSTHDLTRVFRIPGTVNYKGEPVPCRILYPRKGEPERYDFDGLKLHMVTLEAGKGQKKPSTVAVKAVHISVPEGEGIPDAIHRLTDVDPVFKRTWQRNRNDLSDQSPSGYDMSIADQLVEFGCDDQLIAQAIFAWRAYHGENTAKAQRLDYLARTIARAREQHQAKVASELTPPEQTDQPEQSLKRGTEPRPKKSAGPAEKAKAKKKKKPKPVPVKSMTREQLLTEISKAFGFDVIDVTQIGVKEPIYRIHPENEDMISLGSVEELMNMKDQIIRIFKAVKVMIGPFKLPAWMNIISMIGHAAVVTEDREADPEYRMIMWIREHVSESEVYGAGIEGREDWKRAYPNTNPFIRGDFLYISADKLYRFVTQVKRERITKSQFREWLSLPNLGFISGERSWVRVDGQRFCRSYRSGFKAVLNHDPGGAVEHEEDTTEDTTEDKTEDLEEKTETGIGFDIPAEEAGDV